MSKSVLELAVENGKWDSGLKKAVSEFDRFAKNIGGMSQAISNRGKDLEKFVKIMADTATSTDNPKRAFKELTNAIAELTIKYNRLSDSEKNSQFGKQLSKTITTLKGRAGELKDMVGDLNEELGHLASDTKFTDGLSTMTRTVGNCASAFVALSGDSENFKEILLDLAKIQATIAAIESLTKAFQKQNLVLLKNPYVIITTAAITLATAISKLTSKMSEEERLAKEINDITIEANKKSSEQIAKIDVLNSKMHDNALSLKERKSALDEIKSIVPEYHGALSREGELINDNADALENYKNKLLEVAQGQAAFDRIVEIQNKKIQNAIDTKEAKAELERRKSTAKAAGESKVYGREGRMMDTGLGTYVQNAESEVKRLEQEKKDLDSEMEFLKQFISTSSLVSGNKNTTKGSSSFSPNLDLSYKSSMLGPRVTAETMAALDAMAAKDAAYKQQSLGLGLGAYGIADLNNAQKAFSEKMQERFRNEAPLEMYVDLKLIESNDSINEKIENWEKRQKILENMKNTAGGLAGAFNSAASALGQFSEESKAAAAASKAFTLAGAVMQLVAQFTAIPKGPEVWSWIAGTIAGVGTLSAAIASIKKSTSGSYAEGGVVPGKYNGGHDSTISLTSPGELILNRAQQSNIANQLQGGAYVGGNSVISGEQIVSVINAYGRRTGRGEILR